MSKRAFVCVVDDDEAVRVSIQMLIESIGHEVLALPDALSLIADTDVLARANCIILDVRMPGLSGIAAHERLRSAGLATPVIFISGHGDVPMVAKAMRNGASDFIQKPFNEQELLDRIQQVVEVDFTHRSVAAERRQLKHRLETLTVREAEVLERILEGRLNKQIAEDLHISMKTVEQHRAKIMEKMEAETFASLVREMTWYRSTR